MLRNAGGIITDDVIRSLALSQRRLGTREVMLIHHDDCGMQKITEDGFRTELQETTGIAPSFAIESFNDVEEDVRQSIRRVRSSPFLPHRDVGARLRLRRRQPPPAGGRGRLVTPSPPTAPGPRRSRRRPWPEPGGDWAAPAIAADGAVWWAEGRPEEGGRVVLMRRPTGRRARGGDAGRDQRAHPGARVRRRRLVPGRRRTSSSSSTSPTSASTASGWARSRSRSPRSRPSPGRCATPTCGRRPTAQPSSACANATARANP